MSRPPLPVSVAVGVFVVTGFTQASLQLFRGHAVIEKAIADDRFTVTRIDAPRRGSILTADLKPLAQDIAAWELSVKFPKVPKSRSFFAELSAASGVPESDMERLSSTTDVETWPTELTHDQAELVSQVKTRWRADGVSVAASPVRSYPFGLAGAPISGTEDKGVQARGLEGEFESVLRGSPGKRIGLVDRTGSFEPARLDGSSHPPKDGQDVVTAIDSSLQASAAEEVRAVVASKDAVSGSVVVMNPKSGEFLAMAGAPSFNPASPGF